MKRRFRQLTALLLILSMLLMMFSGCVASVEVGGQSESKTENALEETQPDEKEVEILLTGNADYTGVPIKNQLNKDTIYTRELVRELGKRGLYRILKLWVTEEKFYIEGMTDNNWHGVISCNSDFSDVEILDRCDTSGGDDGYDFAVSDSGLIYMMHETQHNASNVDRYWTWTLGRREDNNYLWQIDLEAEWVYGLYCVGERAVVFAEDGLWIYNEEGELQKRFKPWEDAELGYSRGMCVLDENRMLLICGGEYGNYLREINLETGELVDYERPFWLESDYRCQKGYGYDVFITMESSIVGYNLGDRGYTEVMDCVGSGFSESYYSIFSLGDGHFLSTNSGNDRKSIVYLMEKAAPEAVGNRIVITIGGDYMVRKVEGPGYDQIQTAVETFNKNSDIYYIKIDDRYLDYGGIDVWREKKREALLEAVKNGTAPDIILWEDGDLSLTCGIEDFMEDLYLWIDRDAELSREDFLENLLEAYEVDGRLCRITPSVEIHTVAGRRSVVGDKEDWTIDDLEALLREYPELVPGYSGNEYYSRDNNASYKAHYLSRLIALAGEQFIDLEAERCSFDSEEFVRWLKLCGGETVERVEKAAETTGTEEPKTVFGTQTVKYLAGIQYIEHNYGDEVVYVGAPYGDGCGSYITGILPMGIYAESEVKEGAWEFVRYILSKEYQDGAQLSLSIRRDCMAERAEAAGLAADAPVMKLIETVNRDAFYTSEMRSIIQTESRKYFYGEVSAQEAAALIQAEMEKYLGFAGADESVGTAEHSQNGTGESVGTAVRSQTGAEGIVRRIQMGEAVITDLDGDGTTETLTVTMVKKSDGTCAPVIRLNGVYYGEEEVRAMTGGLINPDSDWYYLVDVDMKDAWVEIGLASAGEDEHPETAFLRYDDGEMFGIGKIASGPPLIDDGDIKLIVAGDGTIVGKTRKDIMEKTWIIQEWRMVNGADGSAALYEEADEWYYFYPMRSLEEYPTLVQDMTVYTQRDENSGTMVLPAGTRFSPFQYYPSGQWVKCSYVGGHGAWIKLAEDGTLMPMGISAENISEYIDGLN